MKKIKKNNVLKFPTTISDTERELEALIFASNEPLSIIDLETKITKKIDVKKSLEKLQLFYQNRGINLICISNKWSFRTSEDLSSIMSQQKTVEKKLSKAAVETLSIIVYHQPVTRAEIEKIRGKPVFKGTLDILLSLKWIKPYERRETPGRPVTWVTDFEFLKHFGLSTISDLPKIEELESINFNKNLT